MFCNQCGAKLNEGAKFCPACGAPVAAPSVPEKEDNAVSGFRPAQQPVNTAQQPVNTAQPAAAFVYGAAQQSGYAPSQGQPNGYAPPQGQPNGYVQARPGYPQPQQPGYAPSQGQPNGYAPQQGAYGYGAPPVYPAAPKKKKKTPVALIVVLVIFALIVASAVALVVFLKLRYEEPPLPPITETPAIVAETETAPEDGAATTKPAAETTQPAADTTKSAAGLDSPMSDAQALAAVEKTVGYWNSADQTRFIGISRMDGGIYYFTYAYWYSEADLVGYLRKPASGDPDGIVSLHLYYEGYESEETGYSMPAVDTDVLFDLSRADEGELRCNISGEWEDFSYAGATMDAAMPPYEQLFDVAQ